MSENNEYQYWQDQNILIRSKDDKAWILKRDPIRWIEWKNWRNHYVEIGDWKWDLENHHITPEQAKAVAKYAYDLDEIPA